MEQDGAHDDQDKYDRYGHLSFILASSGSRMKQTSMHATNAALAAEKSTP